jgi:hypothetical protein
MDRTAGYIPNEESIAKFKEQWLGMIAAVCAEEFPAKVSYMGSRTCDYTDLCEITGRDER